VTSLNLDKITVTSAGLTTATTAYTDGDQLGTIMTFLIPGNLTGAVILGAQLTDKANIIGAVDLFLYDRSISLAADNAADSISDADSLFTTGLIEFPYPRAKGLNRLAHIDSISVPVSANVGATGFFGHLVTRSSHTFFGAATDLQVILRISKDV
jgi:hypothetical protein